MYVLLLVLSSEAEGKAYLKRVNAFILSPFKFAIKLAQSLR